MCHTPHIKEMCPMVTSAQDRVLYAKEVPKDPDGLANKLHFPDIFSCKRSTLRSRYGTLCIHFLPETTNKLFRTMGCLFHQDPPWRAMEKATTELQLNSLIEGLSGLPATTATKSVSAKLRTITTGTSRSSPLTQSAGPVICFSSIPSGVSMS